MALLLCLPVLVIRGTGDNIMSQADSEAIAQIVNQVHPGHARYLQIDGMTHGFTVNNKFYEDLVPTILTWMKEQLGAGK
ncbi:MAG: hypothetical protein WCA13_07605 [Terriglobales bacterium]